MTWQQTEEFADECQKQKLLQTELVKVANGLPFFDCCNFVAIMEKRGIHVPI